MQKSTDIRTLKKLSTPTRYTIPDCRGLHLWIRTDGKKYWVFRFTFESQRFDMSLGPFPLITLPEAKAKSIELRRQIYKGINPAVERQEQRSLAKTNTKKSVKFQSYAEIFIEKMTPQWSSKAHIDGWLRTLEMYAFPVIGNLPIETINTAHILQILDPIWETKNVSAARIRGRIEKILSAAITTGLHKGPNPATWGGHLQNLLPHVKKAIKHHEAISYKEIPTLIKKIRSVGDITSLALEFTILTAARSAETRGCSHDELSNDLWTVPAHRMKARQEHLVPLSLRAQQIISEAKSQAKHPQFVFPQGNKKLAYSSMLKQLRSLGYTTETVHGFRSAFRDWVSEETNFNSEIAEMSLAHTIKNKVEAAYRRGKLLQRRKELMEAWETYAVGEK